MLEHESNNKDAYNTNQPSRQNDSKVWGLKTCENKNTHFANL